MVRPAEQKRVRNDAPMFVRQLDLIEIEDDDDILEAIKRKFQADENRQKWIRDEVVSADDLDDYEDRLKEFHRLHFSREENMPQSEEEKKKFGRDTLRRCELEAVRIPVSTMIPYTGYGAGMLHALADHLAIGWHPDWKSRLCGNESEVGDGK